MIIVFGRRIKMNEDYLRGYKNGVLHTIFSPSIQSIVANHGGLSHYDLAKIGVNIILKEVSNLIQAKKEEGEAHD